MKNNQPVTRNEIPFPKGKYLVSKTDLKGSISYANEAFVKISGFERDELLGSNHNMVRHPDMPPQAFEDMWRHLKAGMPWRGMVKNRAKNGDFYWVAAHVVPVTRNGQAIGYMSVRSEPTRQQVAEAEALYRQLNATRAAFNSDRTGPLGKLFNIRRRLMLVMSLSVLVTIVGAVLGLSRISDSNALLEAAYRDDLTPLHQVTRSLALMDGAFKHIALSMQHDPGSRYSHTHDHAVALHLDKISGKVEELVKLRAVLMERKGDAKERELIEAFVGTLDEYLLQGLTPMRALIEAGAYDLSNQVMLTIVAPLYERAQKDASALEGYIRQRGEARRTQAEANYRQVVHLSLWGTLISLLMILAASQWLANSLLNPLRKIKEGFNKIAEGVLTEEVAVERGDEIGELATALATMQVSLKAMLDAIHDSSVVIEQKSVELGNRLSGVVQASNDQADQVVSVAGTTEELSQSAAEVAESAAQALQRAASSRALVVASNDSINQSMAANTKVVEAVRSSGKTIGELDQIIQRIGTITKSIKEIADKTNLLALNAAIEAARAGEVGRGFAVVADEIRNLATHTTNCTISITGMVNEIQRVTQVAVESMNHAVDEVDEGVAKMQQSVEGLGMISRASDEVMEVSRIISAAANQQTEACAHVATKMEQVAALVEDNKSEVGQTWMMMAYLLSTSDQLKNLVDQFGLIKRKP